MGSFTRVSAGALAGLLVIALFGCGSQSHRNSLEVAIFQGGNGIDFFKEKANEFEHNYPKDLTPPGAKRPLSIYLWGSPRVWEQLRPRFVSGDVPDLCWPGEGMDYWKLVEEGQVLPLNRFLAQKAWDQNMPWGQTLNKQLLDSGSYKGKVYILSYNLNLCAWYYNESLFAKHGWTPPRTYPELLALCAKIKKAGIAPITYQGKYPEYMVRGFLLPWAISAGGINALYDAEELKPGAWKSPAFLQAAQMIAQLRSLGYFAKGALGQTHTQAQSDFVGGRAAFIPCGTWLGNEMRDDIAAHPGFKMGFMLVPIVPGGKGDPTALCVSTERWIIPAKAKHPEIAARFMTFVTSLANAKEWVREKHTFTTIKGSQDVKLPPDLAGAATIYANSKQVWMMLFDQWYPQMKDDVDDDVRHLLNGDITPKQCVDRMEESAAEIRADKSVVKHQIMRGGAP